MGAYHFACGIVLAVCIAAVGDVCAEEAEQPLRIERQITRYVVNADGSYVETQEQALKVLKESGIASAKDASVSYSTSIQKADVLHAYTLKPDGRKVAVPASNFQVSSNSGQNGDSPIYSDQTTLTVVFPELAVGDTTVFSYRLTALKPMFAGQFSVIDSYSPATYYGDVRVSIDAPEAMAVKHQAWQLKEVVHPAAKGRKVVEWTWSNRKPVDRESMRDTVFNIERYPGFAYSTFSSYAQIAQAYGAEASSKAVPTERIRKLANEISAGATEPRETAKLLYEWVSKNISYAGNCIGLGAVVPRDTDVVLDNKMGDCKDHATLLQALLAAKSIESTQALINAGSTYTLPDVPVASVVNHVINYIPSLDLYLDSTAATVPFGSLPSGASGKPVLLVDNHRDGVMTPALPTGKDRQRMTSTLSIQPDGSVKGKLRVELAGRLAVGARDQFRNMPKEDAKKLVKHYFQRMSLKAEGELRYDDPAPLLESFWLEADFNVQQMLAVPGGMQVQPWFISFAPISSMVAGNLGDPDQPSGESQCGSLLSDEDYVFEFPATLKIAAMPADVSVDHAGSTYKATYRRADNRVEVGRTLDDRTPGPVCSAEYNTGYQQFLRKIMPDLRAQIVYLPEPAAR